MSAADVDAVHAAITALLHWDRALSDELLATADDAVVATQTGVMIDLAAEMLRAGALSIDVSDAKVHCSLGFHRRDLARFVELASEARLGVRSGWVDSDRVVNVRTAGVHVCAVLADELGEHWWSQRLLGLAAQHAA